MSHEAVELNVLLVEDDPENLKLLGESLPTDLSGCHLHYDKCDSLEEAPRRLRWQRYDLVVTDVYKDRPDHKGKTDEADALGHDIVAEIRQHRFCPIVAFTDGSFPLSLSEQQGAFLKLVDKSVGDRDICQAMEEILSTGIPQIARRLHDELDQAAGPRFLWQFVDSNWDELQEKRQNSPATLERLIRRRAAIQLGKLTPCETDDEAQEVKYVGSPDFYIMPPISKAFRLGHILRRNSDQATFVLLTPHCYLEIQENAAAPRADHVLLVKTLPFKEVIESAYGNRNPWKGNRDEIRDRIRKRTLSPAQIGQGTAGRYWFLPGFLAISDSYCDFMQLQSVTHDSLRSDYEALAVLDTPFAEAFQSCFTAFYASVGLPNLNHEDFMYLVGKPETDNG